MDSWKKVINDAVIEMRKQVRAAKVKEARKLVAKLKNHKRRIEKEIGDVERSKKKIHSLKEEVDALKHVKVDELSMEALSRRESWNKVFQNPKSTKERIAVARLATSPLIQASVEKFRKENPDWSEVIDTVIVLLKEKRAKRQEQIKRLSGIETHEDEGKSEDENVEESSPKPSIDVSKISDESESLSENSILSDAPLASRVSSSSKVDSSQERSPIKKQVIQGQVWTVREMTPQEKARLEKRTKTGIVKVIDLEKLKGKELIDLDRHPKLSDGSDEGISSDDDVSSKDATDRNDASESGPVRDPFFLYDSDDALETEEKVADNFPSISNVQSTNVPNSCLKKTDTDEKKKVQFDPTSVQAPRPVQTNNSAQAQPLMNRKQRRQMQQSRQGDTPGQPNFEKKFHPPTPYHFNNPRMGAGPSNDSPAEKLHPSWEAKRRLKEAFSIKPQGKRIKFDDD